MMTPLLLGTQTYQSRSEAAQGQRLLNCYMETLPKGSSYPFLLICRNGLESKVDFLSSDPVRGMREFNGNLYVVVGQRLYKVTPSWAFESVNDSLNIYGFGDPVFMQDNGFELVIQTTGGQYYVMDTDDVLTEIPLDFIPTSLTFAYQRMLASTFNASNQAFVRIGDLVDATTFDPLLIQGVTEVSDLIVRTYSYNNIIYMLKQTSIEYYVVTDDADAPFQQVPSSTKTYVGLAGAFAVVGADKYLFWLGNDRKIYAGQGYDFDTISTPAIEYTLALMDDVSDCMAYYFVENGHKFVAFDFVSGLRTFVFDIEEKQWHERETFGQGRWQVGFAAEFNGKYIFGSTETGKIYEAISTAYDDDGDFISMQGNTPPIGDGTTRLFFNKLQMNFKRGVGHLSGDYTDPQVELRYTDDGGRTYSNWQPRSIGMIGQYEGRSQWHKQGTSRQRSYQFRITDKVERVIAGFFGDISQGVS